ncbi:MAG TPA: serine hydrolase domain-containing protein [Thermoanaerobaculia bacterium]|nr:serine hydrolase domain-containing protein [Thermoanaerobaculia bacterium]
MTRALPLLALSTLFLSACAGSTPPAPPQSESWITSEEISGILTAAMAGKQVPGMAAAVAHAEGPVLAGAVGVRILGKPEAITPGDRFHIGSVTKPMTATVIATLVEEGKLRWDTTVAEALPECGPTMRPEYREVTIAHLLSHEGGLPAFGEEEEFVSVPKTEGSPTAKRLAFSCHALAQPPAAKPKEEFLYSNAGFAVAGTIAEKVTGTSWEELLKARVFAPLGLSTAGFGWPAQGGAPQPWGHWEEKGPFAPHDPDGEYKIFPIIAPAGDVHLSMPDLARFLRAHLRALHGDDRLLDPGTARLMQTRRIRGGLGWGVQKVLDLDPVSVYQGSGGTFITVVAIAQEADVVVAVSANAATEAADAAAREALKQLLSRYARNAAPKDR